MVPRSQRLLTYQFTATGGSPAWSSPDGTVTLVKSVVFYNSAAVEAHANLIVYESQTTVGATFAQAQLAPQASAAEEFWVVLNPGDMIWATCDQVGVAVWLSGAVLTGANLYPPAELRRPPIMGDDVWRAPS